MKRGILAAVVATALPGFAHVVGDAGVLTAPGDDREIAAVVARLLADDAARNRLQEAARERVARYDRAVVVSSYLDAYEEAMSAHRE